MKQCKALLPVIALMATSCIDDSYDLSDIDTTSRLQVNDLTLPVNMDNVTLGDIITFDEGSRIKPVTINGKEFYALSEEGEFHSDGIYIDKVWAKAPSFPTISESLNLLPASRAVSGDIKYDIVEMGNDFCYTANDIDTSIDEITAAGVDPLSFTLDFSAPDAASFSEKITLTDVIIAMPLGLTATTTHGTYDPTTGIWKIASITLPGVAGSATLTATVIDMAANGCSIKNGSVTLKSQFRVKSGVLVITPKAQLSTEIPSQLRFKVDFSLNDMTINSMSGRMSYKLDGMSINPISLNDIPDFLAGDETNLGLGNPQIYLQLNNPVAANRLRYSTGIRLGAVRKSGPVYSFAPDNGGFTVGFDKNVSGPYNFVLAPGQENLAVPGAFADGLEFVKFSSLGDLLSTPAGAPVKGLPESITVDLVDPQIPMQNVDGFELGRTLEGVRGRYELVAPLALTGNSVVVYTDREDGWNDDDIDALTITKLCVRCVATNNCPVGATLKAYPIDVRGNRISGVEIKTTQPLKANTPNQEIVIEMTGTVTHLDGIIYEATLSGSNSGEALSPSQTVELKNIRATVSGYYEKEL